MNLYVKVQKTDSCWLWTGAVDKDGYPVDRKHRKFFEAFKGPVPKGLSVMHICDVRNCVNPEHLILGTHRENMLDRNKKSRHAFGERHGRAKLTVKAVKEIRQLYSTGKVSFDRIAMQYNVSRTAIRNAVKGGWKNV